MHCELVAPGLFAAPAAERLPSLELLLARGRRASAASQHLEEWLCDAFRQQPLAAGALTLLGVNRDPGADRWVRADPVHLRLMRDRLLLMPVKPEEAQTLADELNRHFGERLPLQVLDAERWVAKVPDDIEFPTQGPLQLAGREVDVTSGDAKAHQLLNESQMVLHAQAESDAGEMPVNSLWFWGAGRTPRVEAEHWHSVTASEPIALGLARAAGIRHRPLPASAEAWLDRVPEDGRHLIVLDTLRYGGEPAALERDWFAPLLAALRTGRIGMVTLHVPDAAEGISFEAIRGDLRRFWRRPRSLEHYA